MNENNDHHDLSSRSLVAYQAAERQFKQENYSKAIVSYHIAIELNSSFPEAYFGRGIAYLAMRKLDLALYDASQAILLKADYALAHYLQGAVCYALGNWSTAKSCLVTAATLFLEKGEEPEFNRISSILQQIQAEPAATQTWSSEVRFDSANNFWESIPANDFDFSEI